MNARRSFVFSSTFLFAAATACAGSCSNNGGGGGGTPTPNISQCDAGLPSFVRNASLAVLGHRPLGQKDVNQYVLTPAGDAVIDTPQARKHIVDLMMADPEFIDRWQEAVEDMLRVAKTDDQAMYGCYSQHDRSADDGALARYVASHDPTDPGSGQQFSMLDLLDSSLKQDDLSVVYRAHMFALVAFPIPAANVGPVEAELARRQDFGNVFDAAYLNRDMVCLNCHNSEFSVTDSADPATDRHWPIPGLFEKALFGASTGESGDVAHAMLRFDGFVNGPFNPVGGAIPVWGWDGNACGSFAPNVADDIANVSAKFGNITGTRTSVFDLEGSLKRGVDSLAANGLQRASDGTITDPDQAFAYLVAASITEGVWREIIGSGLTIANYFPRNKVSRDELVFLTDHFVATKFSLKALLHDIVEGAYFNQLAPEAGCTAAAYGYPNIYDPWVIGDSDPAKRLNSSADGVAALPARVMTRAAYDALQWPLPTDDGFPASQASEDYYRGVGQFLKNSERGFRGLDFQARLVWENKVGACAAPGGGQDFVDTLVGSAGTKKVRDVVLALKDRMLDDATVDESAGSSEKAALEAIYGTALDSAATSAPDLAGSTRKLCGVYLSAPQFLLSGFSSTAVDPVPALAP